MEKHMSTDFTNEQVQTFLQELRPAELIDDPANGVLLSRYLKKHNLTPTVANLHTAARDLVDMLNWKVRPAVEAPPTKAETDAALRAQAVKMMEKQFHQNQRDKEENSEDAFYERKKRAEAEDAAKEAKLADEIAEQKIRSAIMMFEVYKGPGRVDYTRTDSLRKDLFGIEVRVNGKRDPRRTLAAVQEAISKIE
jgi:hypothetical protein